QRARGIRTKSLRVTIESAPPTCLSGLESNRLGPRYFQVTLLERIGLESVGNDFSPHEQKVSSQFVLRLGTSNGIYDAGFLRSLVHTNKLYLVGNVYLWIHFNGKYVILIGKLLQQYTRRGVKIPGLHCPHYRRRFQ